jgi:hypothetical protein
LDGITFGVSRTGRNLGVGITLKGTISVLDGIDIRGLNPLYYSILPDPDDLLAFVFSDYTGCFHLLTNVQQKLRSLPFLIHQIVILIMGRNGNARDVPLLVPSCRDNDPSDLGYFARTFSQKRTAL